MGKKGQIALFIILGVIVLAIVVMFFYTRNQAGIQNQAGSAEIGSVEVFVGNCVNVVAENAVVDVSSQGGYFNPPINNIRIGSYIPFYMYWNESVKTINVPSKENVESELSKYMNNGLKECVNNLTLFRERGYNVEIAEPESKATILEKGVLFEVNYPATLTLGNKITKISKFNTEVKAPMLKMLSTSKTYMDAQNKSPNLFLLGDLIDESANSKIKSETFKVFNNVIINLIDYNTIIKNNPYTFTFAIEYNWTG